MKVKGSFGSIGFEGELGGKQVLKCRYVFVLLALISGLFVANAPTSAAPELAFPEGSQVDLGTTTEGQLLRGSFTMENVGNEELKIKNYIVTCGCLELIERKKPALPPGESFNLEFVFDTSDLAGKKAKKSIIVFSNAKNAPTRLYVSTKVRRRKGYQVDSHEITEEFDIFVDVRSPEAYAANHIIGAINVPVSEFSDWLQNLPDGVTLYLYSEHGEKSDRLVEKFGRSSNPELKSLIGGFVQWKLQHEDYVNR